MPNFTWAAPPYYASQMVYANHLANGMVANVTATPLPFPAVKNLTVFGEVTPEKDEIVLRFVNDNNVSVATTFEVLAGAGAGVGASGGGGGVIGSFCSAGSVVKVQTLSSPYFGTPEYDARDGGWNSPTTPTRIATKNSTITWPSRSLSGDGGGCTYTLPPMSFVVMRFKQQDAQ